MKIDIFRDPKNPEKIIAESYLCRSGYKRIRDINGKPCSPWVREEWATINVGTMEGRDQRYLAKYQAQALPRVQKFAEELASKELASQGRMV